MSATESLDTMKTFFVWQPALGAPLEFSPALGTQELDNLVHAYVPGPATIQEKRALISLDFFEYAQITGATVKYYSVDVAPTRKAPSSEGLSPMHGSGYNSSFVSPVTSNWSWQSPSPTPVSVAASTPSSSAQDLAVPKARNAVPKKASSRASVHNDDFSHIPGMKIMTKDGRDVTNSASRGCKTKEQRDHAHLMRIIKACDACRRKKVRCDPSHKKRTSGPQASTQPPSQSQSHSRTRPARPAASSRKSKKPACPTPAAPPPPPEYTALAASLSDFGVLLAGVEASESAANHQDPWEAFVQYEEEEPYSGDVSDWNMFFDSTDYTSPDSNMSTSPTQPCTATQPPCQHVPSTEAQSSPRNGSNAHAPDLPAPNLPYLSGASGSNYVDFNLFSPANSFVDEDSMPRVDIGANLSGHFGTSSFDTLDPSLLEECNVDWAVSRRPVVSKRDQGRSISSAFCPEPGSQPASVQHKQLTMPDPEWDEAGSSQTGPAAGRRNAVFQFARNSTTQGTAVASEVDLHGQSSYAASTTQNATHLVDKRDVTVRHVSPTCASEHSDKRGDADASHTVTADQNIRSRPVPRPNNGELSMQSNSRLQSIAQVEALGVDGGSTPAQTKSVHANSTRTNLSGPADAALPGSSWEERTVLRVTDARSQQQRHGLSDAYAVGQQARDSRLSIRGILPENASPGYTLTEVPVQAVTTSSNTGRISGEDIPSEPSGFNSQHETSTTQNATLAVVALGVVAWAAPQGLQSMVCMIAHFALGLMALGSVFGPSAVWPGPYEQRTHATKNHTQPDKPASTVSHLRGDWTSRIRGLCRQIQNAHSTAVAGRLATHRLQALTQ
ncbi:hypothetical protein SODALDRAFT_198994 [Sodiomyces alkalinus F11]|uniref:Zn(2)-C6 fungal-type domain-containing protein n=1 Tax=Sodiomyces alkalinus (strain CBS 110278 / VKM F-3762 / F11) TaxID=1314773 RepID=A0A3N2PT80_SODAK|nr:hypothetical protein SODALDRAFT_198994 [Sodiomyces alkalinus F11]ROT37516.1 hypothetical protein SODALDRAFT_198994 [Sodiomyces alkalinus F11]